jgi:alpha-N-arabinofuranosidase
MNLVVELRGLGSRKVLFSSQLHHDDLKAANTKEQPETVVPKNGAAISLTANKLTTMLQPRSWNVIVLEPA